MFIRTATFLVWACALLAATSVYASHQAGETVSLVGASADGRMAVVVVEDVQGRYADVRLLDVDGLHASTKRFLAGSGVEQKAYVRQLRRTHRIRRPPSARMQHPTRPLEGWIYTWRAEPNALVSAFSLVGPLGQNTADPIRVSCFKTSPSSCPANQSGWSKSRKTKVHWFGGDVYLVVANWTVKDDAGDEVRAIVVHERLPARPGRPASPPEARKEGSPAVIVP